MKNLVAEIISKSQYSKYRKSSIGKNFPNQKSFKHKTSGVGENFPIKKNSTVCPK